MRDVSKSSQLQAESLESNDALKSGVLQESLESSKGRGTCNRLKSREENLESSQGREVRTKGRESGRRCDGRWLIWGGPRNNVLRGTISRILRMFGHHTRNCPTFSTNVLKPLGLISNCAVVILRVPTFPMLKIPTKQDWCPRPTRERSPRRPRRVSEKTSFLVRKGFTPPCTTAFDFKEHCGVELTNSRPGELRNEVH